MSTAGHDRELADLARRLTHLEDVRAIEQLKYRYAACCDDGYDPDGIAGCFVEDGRWVVDGEGASLAGRDEIRAHFRALSSKISWAMHNVLAPRVEISPDGLGAVGHFYMVCLCTIEALDDPSGKDAVILTVDYTDRFVKHGGTWFIEELRGRTHQVSNWDQGWVRQPMRG